MQKRHEKTNPRLLTLITTLKEASRTNEVALWRDIANRLESPRRNYAEVNISKISRYASGGDTLLVPGKVLGTGALDQAVVVAALNFSGSAETKIRGAKGACLTIEELLAKNPTGSRVRILR